MDGDEASKIIQSENPSLNVSVVPEGLMVTMDYRTDRVIIYVNKARKVSSVPRIG